jgi:ABC-2 type transport system permease protein
MKAELVAEAARTDVLVETGRARARSTLWWSLGLAAVVALTVAFYPSVRGDASLNDYVENLPDSVRALFVGGELDITSAAGYLNSQIFALVAPLILLVFAIGHGSGAVAGEEERGTLDLLLAQPLRRRDYVVQRFGAMTMLLVVLSLVLLVTTALGALPVDLHIGFDKLAAASVSVGLLALLFGALALAVGAARPGRSSAIGVSAGVAVFAWLFDGLSHTVGSLEGWRPVSPFYWALGKNALRDGAQWTAWAVLLAATAVLVVVAAIGLERRDARL